MRNIFRKLQITLVFGVTFFVLGACGFFNDEEDIDLDNELVSIEVNIDRLDVEYDLETFDLSKIQLILNFADGSTETIALTKEMLNEADLNKFLTSGSHLVTVRYENLTTTFTLVLTQDEITTILLSLFNMGVMEGTITESYDDWLESIKGQDGISVTDAKLNAEGDLVLVLSDSTEIKVGNVIGAPGKSAFEIYQHHYPDYQGTEAQWLDDLINGMTVSDQTFTVSFDTQGGESLSGISEVHHNQTIELPIPEKDGYDFIGWFYGTTINDGPFYNQSRVTEDLTLYAQWGKVELGLVYEIIDDEVFITGTNYQLPKDAYVPSEIEGYPVVGIKEAAFFINLNLETLLIGKNVSSIERSAFEYALNLREIRFEEGSNLKRIERNTFTWIPYLKVLEIPSSVEYIAEYAISQNHEDLVIYIDFDEIPSTWDKNWNGYGYPVYLRDGTLYEPQNPLIIFQDRVEIDDVLSNYAQAWGQANGIEVEIRTCGGGYCWYQDQLGNELNSKTPPDIFVIGNQNQFLQYIDYITPLNGEAWIDETDFAFSYNQDVYGFPTYLEGWGLAYNKDILDELSIDPATLTTLEGYAAAFEIIQNAIDNNQLGDVEMVVSMAAGQGMTWVTGLHNFNGYLSSGLETDDRTVIDDLLNGVVHQNRLEALADWVELLFQYSDSMILMDGMYDTQVNAFKEGRAVFIHQGNWIDPNLMQNGGITFEVGISPHASGLGAVDALFIDAHSHYVVNANSAHMALAKKFLNDLALTEAGHAYMVNDAHLIPAFKNIEITLEYPLASVILDYVKLGKTYAWWQNDMPLGFGMNDIGYVYREFALGNIDKSTFIELITNHIEALAD